MTCKRAPRDHVLNFVSLLITTFVTLIAVVAPAQLTAGGQLPAKPTVVPTSQDASTPVFLPAITYPSGGHFAASVAVGDLKGDGGLDAVVANANSNTVGVLLSNHDGTFHAPVIYGSGGRAPESVVVADVNGDGRPDLVVANACGSTCASGVVGVLLGNGDGTFQQALDYSSGGIEALSVVVTDLSGDGLLDIVVSNQLDNTLGVLLGKGDGTFQAAVNYASGSTSFTGSQALADLNGDGRPDLVVAAECVDYPTCTNGAVSVLLGNGDGTFRAAMTYSSGGGSGRSEAKSVAVADVNGDGKPDLLVGNAFSGTVGVLLGNGDGTFHAVVNYDTGFSPVRSVGFADVNGDGIADLLVGGDVYVGTKQRGEVGYLLNTGDGTFQPIVTFRSGGNAATSIVSSDVNGDGQPDLLVANAEGNTVGVLLHNSSDTVPPVITLSATPKVLWPPKGKMVPVSVSGTITDTGSGVNVNSAAYSVEDEYGEVQPRGAITLGPGGAYSFTFLLQGSRLGTDLDGRRYTIRVRAKDNAGNNGSKASVVTVPHDQGS